MFFPCYRLSECWDIRLINLRNIFEVRSPLIGFSPLLALSPCLAQSAGEMRQSH
ncbi:hypothetical protein [Kamptonema formosum]|uniref:hypothetical protein n=1 Tax=Kamptonema formosum TaxID=331992 RepID=UPI0003465009|nr:hypothetical protein [Oscillatoria sp. PCC 10802]